MHLATMRRYRIGRSETNDIVIPDASVSRQHAEAVELGDGRFTLSDLGSTFGTHVWQGQIWVAAAGTEIGADTVIRFGEFRTTLMDILSEPERAALGLASGASPAAPQPSPPIAPAAPRTATHAPRPEAPAARPRRSSPERQRRAMLLGLAAVGGVFALAVAAIVVILAFGSAGGPERGPAPQRTAAGEGQRKFLAACTGQWGVAERRCRCFLAAAGPNLQAEDYDDFADLVDAYVSRDAVRSESVLQRAAEKRGTPASARLSAAFKGVVRDCQQ